MAFFKTLLFVLLVVAPARRIQKGKQSSIDNVDDKAKLPAHQLANSLEDDASADLLHRQMPQMDDTSSFASTNQTSSAKSTPIDNDAARKSELEAWGDLMRLQEEGDVGDEEALSASNEQTSSVDTPPLVDANFCREECNCQSDYDRSDSTVTCFVAGSDECEKNCACPADCSDFCGQQANVIILGAMTICNMCIPSPNGQSGPTCMEELQASCKEDWARICDESLPIDDNDEVQAAQDDAWADLLHLQIHDQLHDQTNDTSTNQTAHIPAIPAADVDDAGKPIPAAAMPAAATAAKDESSARTNVGPTSGVFAFLFLILSMK